jgi:hypothetical protein
MYPNRRRICSFAPLELKKLKVKIKILEHVPIDLYMPSHLAYAGMKEKSSPLDSP